MSKPKLIVITNGLDLKKFWPKRGYQSNRRLLHVGRLGYEKNVDVVLEAFALIAGQLTGWTLVIAGDGPARKSLGEKAKELGIERRVKWLGMVKRDRLPGVYRGADVFATASDMETLGLVVLEAMACGLPVVAVDKYAMKDMVKDGVNGYRVKPGDAKAMADSVLKLAADESLRTRMGESSREMSEDYSLEEAISQLEVLYRKLIGWA